MNSNIIWFLYFYYLSYLRLYLKKKDFDPLFDNAVFAFNFIYIFIYFAAIIVWRNFPLSTIKNESKV